MIGVRLLKKFVYVVIAVFVVSSVWAAEANKQSQGYQLVKKSYDMWRGESSSKAKMTMQIIRPNREVNMTLESWSKGDSYSMAKFREPAKYKGQAILVDHDSMWTYSPKSRRSIKIASSLKSKAWMGSDMSYDDISVSIEMLNHYTFKMLPSETIDGNEVYIIEAIPLKDAPVVWGKEIYKIRKFDGAMLVKDFYDQSGVAVKRFQALKISYYQGDKSRPLMSHMRVFNLEKEGHYTDFIMDEVEFNVPIDDKVFSLSNLSKP